MSNTDFDEDFDPTSYIARQQQASRMYALGSLADDPEKAARAVELGDATGDKPALIYGNLENYEEQHKAALTASLLNSNKYLREYVDADPMHAKISNDDYGNLDSLSESVQKLSLSRPGYAPDAISGALAVFSSSIAGGAITGFKRGWANVTDPKHVTDEDLKNYPLFTALMQSARFPVDVGGALLEAGIEAIHAGAKTGYKQITGDEMGAERFSRDIAGMAETVLTNTSGYHGIHAPSPAQLEKVHGILDKAKPWLDDSKEPPRGLDPEIDKLKFEQNKLDLDNLDEALKAAQSSATRERSPEIFASFIRQHTDASIGISGDAVAKLYGDKVPEAGDNILGWSPRIAEEIRTAVATGGDVQIPLADWLAKVDPEVEKALHDDIRVRPGGITKNEQEIAKDYIEGGYKPAEIIPEPADLDARIDALSEERNSLNTEEYQGVPNTKVAKENVELARALETARAVGFNHEQAMESAKWALENGRPDIAQVLVDRAAKRAGKPANVPGLPEGHPRYEQAKARIAELKAEEQTQLSEIKAATKLESTEGAIPKPPEIIPEPLPSVRGASGLEPMFSQGDRKLTLEKRPPREKAHGFSLGPDASIPADEFKLIDENGKNAGWLEVVPFDGGKRLYVDNVGGYESKGYGPNAFGPALTRDIARQLKEAYPEATHIGGFRISGAREKAGTTREIWIKFDELEGSKGGLSRGWLHEILNPTQTFDIGKAGILHYSPEFAPHQAEADKIIRATLARIAPDAQVFTPSHIEVPGKPFAVRGGFMLPMLKQNPWIVVALDAADALGVARHEAVHYLKQFGFFSEKEWFNLTRAARDNDWIKKFRIDERYPDLDMPSKLEEAIAEGYRNWARGEEVPSHLHPIFERLKELFESLKSQLKELLGREPTWEELFQKMDTGEVGARKPRGHEGGAFLEPKMMEEPEKIVGATFTIEGRTFTGANHVEAMEKANKELGSDVVANTFSKLISAGTRRDADGFMTSTGRVVSRDEATKISEAAEQGTAAHPSGTLKAEDIEPKFSVEDKPMFDKAAAVGMTADQFKRYMKLIDQRHTEDLAAAQARAEAEQGKRLTKEWKDNEKQVRQDVSESIRNRPDVAADLFFGAGELYGSKIDGRFKIGEKYLSPEQKAKLPRSYVSKSGINPDDFAGEFGYSSGDAMIDRLGEYNEAKLQAGMSTKDYVKRVTDLEVDRQMQIKYGSLEKSVLEEAQDQATSETQVNILHEETLALALRNNAEGSISKDEIRSWVKQEFANKPIGSISFDSYMTAMGKAGRAAEDALLKGDFAEAFRAKQQQYVGMLYAREAKQLEKARTQFDKFAKRYNVRTIKDQPAERQAWTDAIHGILQQVELPTGGRDSAEVLGSLSKAGYKDIASFIQAKEFPQGLEGQRQAIIPVANFLLDGSFKKPLDQVTAAEFKAIHDSVKTLDHQAKAESKVIKGGEKADREETMDQLVNQIEQRAPSKELRVDLLPSKNYMKHYLASSINLETIFDTIDRNNPRGLMNQTIVRTFTEPANEERALWNKFGDRINALPKIKSANKLVDNPFFKDPRTGELMIFSRRNVLTVLQNMGNPGNFYGLLRGYGIKDAMAPAVKDWVWRNVDKEDVQRAKMLGSILEDSKHDHADPMYRYMTGIEPPEIDLWTVDAPATHGGPIEGWYHPIIYDLNMPQKSAKLAGQNVIEQPYYVKRTPTSGYTQVRTGYTGPYSLQLDGVQTRLGQVIHDAVWRPALDQLTKIFMDQRFQTAMQKHWGKEYADQLEPFLRSIAGTGEFTSESQAVVLHAIQFVRTNMLSHLVGLNPSTFAKHTFTAAVNSITQVGLRNYADAQAAMFARNPATGETNWTWHINDSEELQGRHRHFIDTVRGSFEATYGHLAAANDMKSFLDNFEGRSLKEGVRAAASDVKAKYLSIREALMYIESAPLAYGDLFTAVPTRYAAYEKAIAEGADRGQAKFEADRAVRMAHGSTALTNRPQIMRNNGFVQTFTSFYGFFSHMLQRQYQLAWMIRDSLKGEGVYVGHQLEAPHILEFKEGRDYIDLEKDYTSSAVYKTGLAAVPVLAGMLVSYALWPGIWDNVVQPHPGADKDSWPMFAGKVIGKGLCGSWVGIREVCQAAVENGDISAGVLGSGFNSMMYAFRDTQKAFSVSHMSRDQKQKYLKDFNAMFSMMTGLSNNSVPRMGVFGYNWAQGYDKPKGLREIWTGITHGKSKPTHH